ncbi:MAG TPA: imidazolonepropionase [Phycisphaerae bacterium]|nr:imidazolonepropionase [Phycisphaerae bacterium]
MLLINNIAELVTFPPGPIPGTQMRNVQRLRDASLLIDGRAITGFGPHSDVHAPPGTDVIDAAGGCVVPGLIDCHTHAVYAGTRENEFVQRIEGKTYVEIAESGGGINASVRGIRSATVDDLVESTLPRLHRMLQAGTTTAEIKSGYGLTVDDELKMLRAVRQLRDRQPIELVGTYLAAHTIPREFAGRPDEYLDLVLADEVFERIKREDLAEFCDVFCERSAFDVDQSRRVLETARRHGLIPRVHADQITQMGASRLAAEVGAISADHLETTDDESIAALAGAGTIGVLLPACSFFLSVDQAPARKLIEADLPIALATDLNPGSSMIESMALTMSIACTQMRLTPAEALVAATANAAAAINRHNRIGAIATGMQADLLILDVPRFDQWAYHVGRNCVRTVIKAGRVIVDKGMRIPHC